MYDIIVSRVESS